jgi:hypothetical protein
VPPHDDVERHQGEVRAFLAEVLPAQWPGYGALSPQERDEFRGSWRAALARSGYIAPGWPRRYGGRDASLTEQMVITQEFIRAGVPPHPTPNDPLSLLLLGPTLLQCGTEEQRERFLPATVSGEIAWAQGYSEPEAGSDLFGLRTRGVRIDGGWRVNGQKIWQTAGLTANWIFALIRTDPEVAKAKGLTFVLCPLDAPGIEVRGIRNAVGEEEFAEVFFTDVEIPDDLVVGGAGNGARVALTLLGYERALGGFAHSVAFEFELSRLAELARDRGFAGDQLVRDRIARCATKVRAIGSLSRGVLDEVGRGIAPGPESSLIKLLCSEYRQQVTTLAIDLLGSDLLAPTGPDGPYSLGAQPLGVDPTSARAWLRDYLQARPGTVYGGSSQIQRNTIAEQVLGLPREKR